MSDFSFDSRYYRLMLDTLNTVYREQGLDAQVGRVLGIIGAFINVSRVYIFEDDFEAGMTKNTYEWCAEGVASQIDELGAVPHSAIGSWHEMLRRDGIIRADDLYGLPSDIYEILAPQGILSIVVLPLYIDGELFGYIGFDECKQHRSWSGEEIEALRALSNLVTNLIARHHAEQKAAAVQKTLHTVLDNIDTPIYATDPKTSKILFANRKLLEMLGADALEGKICWQVLRLNETGECDICKRKQLSRMEPGAVLNWEVYNDLIGQWYYCTDRLVEWTDGRTAHLQAALDITARKEYEERLKFSATYDKMMGIYNRESGLTLLRDMMEACRRENLPMTFCFLDVDGLKHVNDTFGHAEGDRLLISAVGAVKSSIRTTDLFARLGGDEFMLALRACPLDNAWIVMKKITDRLNELSASGAYPYSLSFSVGFVEVPPGLEWGVDTLLAEADKKMYADKEQKRRG